MTFRSRETLEQWLTEFREARGAGERIRVIIQDGSEGADTGLVVVPLSSSSASIYMEPAARGDDQWRVTLEPHDVATVLDSHELHGMAVELAVAADLCAYLQERSAGHVEPAR